MSRQEQFLQKSDVVATTEMKHHRSQPEDYLSSCMLLLSRQTISCRDKRGKFASWAIFDFALKLMTTHILKPEVKTSRVQINRIINSV